MKTKKTTTGIVPWFLVTGIMTLVLISGCSSPSADSPPPLITTTTPATPQPPAPSLPVTGGGTCRPGLTWCNGHCSDLSADIGDCGACGTACPSGQACTDGQCCPRGQALCNGVCSDPATDRENCGRCGNACPDGSVCSAGKCLNMNIVCPPGQTGCPDERCHDLTSENMNCGRCGNVCPAYSGCTNGVCVAMDDENLQNYVINMPL